VKTIEIDDAVYASLLSRIEDFGDTPNTILRRLLDISTLGDERKTPGTRHHVAGQRPAAEHDRGERGGACDSDDPLPHEEADDQPARKPEAETQTVDSPVTEFLRSSAFPRYRPALSRFLALLSWLHKRHAQDFGVAALVRGRRRLYFAEDAEAIRHSGSSTMPQQIPETTWFVTANTSTRLKQVILKKLLIRLRYDTDSVQQAVKSLA
jgi:negative modulator of initiation of replication